MLAIRTAMATTHRKSEVKIIYLDQSRDGNTPATRMLNAGTNFYNTSDFQDHIDLELAGFDEVDANYRVDSERTVAFINIASSLCHRNDDNMVNICRPLEVLHSLVENNPDLPVYLIPQPNKVHITGLDAIGVSLSGASGIVDERGLIMKEILSITITHKLNNNGRRQMLLFGEMPEKIRETKTTLLEWEEDYEVETKYDYATWRTANALAQLAKLEPIIGSGHLTSFSTLASALNLAKPMTNFQLNRDDLRRILATLARRWLAENHEPIDRFRLPDHARENGFPMVPPPIVGLDKAQAERKIYDTLKQIRIDEQSDLVGIKRCVFEYANTGK